MIPVDFAYARPGSLADTLAVLDGNPGARLLAGGQSLLTQLKTRTVAPDVVVDIGGLDELRAIRLEDDRLVIGAMVTMASLTRDAAVARAVPILPLVLRHVADVQVRNRGTLGGSLAYADPSGDLAGAAIASGASVRLASSAGEREVPVAELYTGPFRTVLRAGEVLTAVSLPRRDGARASYGAVARRPADPTLAGVAVVADVDGGTVTELAIGLVGLGDRPLPAPRTAAAVRGRPLGDETIAAARAELDAEIAPLDSTAGSADYRRAVAPVALERALREAVGDDAGVEGNG